MVIPSFDWTVYREPFWCALTKSTIFKSEMFFLMVHLHTNYLGILKYRKAIFKGSTYSVQCCPQSENIAARKFSSGSNGNSKFSSCVDYCNWCFRDLLWFKMCPSIKNILNTFLQYWYRSILLESQLKIMIGPLVGKLMVLW